MPRIFLLVVFLIVYGSLFPWEFHSKTLPGSVPEILMRGWPTMDRWSLRDAFINILIYIPLGTTAFLSYRRRCGGWLSALLAIFTGVLLSTAIELAQIFDRSRTPSAFDICCNSAGTLVGVWLSPIAHRHQRHAVSVGKSWTRSPAASALLVLWVLHGLYPLMPSLSTYTLRIRLRLLLHPHWTWIDVFTQAAVWIAVAILAKTAARERSHIWFACLLLLVPARLFVAGGGPTPANFLAAGAAAVFAFALWRRLTPRLGAVVLIAAISVRELVPLHFMETRQPFLWTPFAATLGADWVGGLAIILRKSSEYGMAVWMLWAEGAGWIGAAGLVTLLLAAGEVAQMWLPGRTPEITDPLMALLMAFVLRTLQHDRAPRLRR